MIKFLKFLAVAVIFFTVGFGFVVPLAYESDHKRDVNLSFEGEVEYIEWESWNHALPLFIIKSKNGKTRNLNNGELTINRSQLKVGDSISKKSGSRYCTINGIETECVREFVSFHKQVSKVFNKGA